MITRGRGLGQGLGLRGREQLVGLFSEAEGSPDTLFTPWPTTVVLHWYWYYV